MFEQKNVLLCKELLRKADQKMMSNILPIKSDILPDVKLDDVNNTEMGKDNKSVKMRTQILFKLSGSMFFKWKK